MPSFLLECFSEEIPSRMQRSAAEQLARAFTTELETLGISFSAIHSFAAPRHLAVQIKGLPQVQPDRTEEKKGPKTTAPQAALDGFAQSIGKKLSECETRKVGKDDVYFATITTKGKPSAQALTEIATRVLAQFTWPKSMRWGAHEAVWVRPLHAITALFDDQVLPVTFAHLTARNISYGHRFLAPDAITIAHADAYEEALRNAKVIVDFAARKEAIRAQIADVAASHKLSVVEDDALLGEITGLIEWPNTYLGTFDESFLKLPREVLISEMKHHQRYVALTDGSGALSNHFIVVSNMEFADGGKVVVEGNARVLRARLSDGAFYYDTDKATALESWAEKLRDVVFHAKVGMMSDKVARIEALALKVAEAVNYSKDKALLSRAARLCKADLTSGMVGEFPDLQGIMGRYYATAQGEPESLSQAIYEHYKPQGAGDDLPASDEGAILSIADKLDSILSLWAAGEKPTGSKDPLALRRAAIGVLRILLARGWPLNLETVFPSTYAAELRDFFTDRMRQMLKDDGVRHDIIEAALGVPEPLTPLTFFARAKELQAYVTGQQASLAAIKRALNILSAEEKKAKTSYRFAGTSSASLQKPAEQKLHQALKEQVVSLAALSSLTAPINQFFDDVLVTEEGFKDTRLSLLAGVRETTLALADFSKIEG